MKLTNEQERRGYALGINMAEALRQFPFELDKAAVIAGFSDLLNGSEMQISQEEYVQYMTELQQQMEQEQQKRQSASREVLEKNQQKEKAFMAENAKAPGVKSTASGLQYQVLTEGDGEKPGESDRVLVHYTGTLLDGTVFDSSVERGEPAEFVVNQVIPGWTEALQNMKVGSKHRLFIPAALAYGERGAGGAIEPGATLVFDVELLDIVE